MGFPSRFAGAFLVTAAFFSEGAHGQTADETDCGRAPAQGALAACTRVIKTETDSVVLARAYFNRGIAREAKGQLKTALQDYSKAIELNPNYSPPHNNRGIIYAQQGRHKQALQEYNRAIEIDPDNLYALNSRGRHHLLRGKNPELALLDFERAVQLDRNYAVSFANRGFAYQKLGKKKEALADFETALKLNVTPEQKALLMKEIRKLRR